MTHLHQSCFRSGSSRLTTDDSRLPSHDHLYSPVAYMSWQGNVSELYEYDAYGSATIYNSLYQTLSVPATGNRYLFTGREVDYLDNGSLALQYNPHRYYSQSLGRWTSEDPAGYVNDLSLYQYAYSQPTGSLDPSGLYRWVDNGNGGRRLRNWNHHMRLVAIRAKWNMLAARTHNNPCYTVCEAIVDLAQWMLTDPSMKGEYLHWYNNDETKFIHDLGFVLGGVEGDQSWWAWIHQETNLTYMGQTYFVDAQSHEYYSGFQAVLNDNSNTVRHIFTMITFAYEYGDTLGNIAGWWRDRPGTGTVQDRIAAYVAADLGEEMDDAVDFGPDLEDFGEAFARDFCDEPANSRLNETYGW